MLKAKKFKPYVEEVRALMITTDGENKKEEEKPLLLPHDEWNMGDAPKRQKHEA
jgi:hypothetical protein